MFDEDKTEDDVEEEEPVFEQAPPMSKPQVASLTIDQTEQESLKDTFFQIKLSSDGEPDTSDGKIHLVPVYLREFTDDMGKEQFGKSDKIWIKWIFPISMLINIVCAFAVGFLGMWQPFMFTLFLSVILMAAIYLAGENFWMWLQVFINRKKNWALKLRSYATSRKVLTYEPVKEKERFIYTDKGGKKRYSETHIRKLDFIHNLGLPFLIAREGYPNNISIEDNYPFSQLNRQIDQDNDMAFAAGSLSVADELMDLLKNRRSDLLLYILLGVVVLILLGLLYMINQQPEQMAAAMKAILPAAQTAGQAVNDVNRQVIQVAVK